MSKAGLTWMLALAAALNVALVALPASCRSSQGQTERLETYGGLRVGDDAPTFAGWDLEGQLVSLKRLLLDQRAPNEVLVVSFFATWCGPCKEGLPVLERFQHRVADDDVKVLLISVDASSDGVGPFLAELGVELDVVLDPFQKIAANYGLADGAASIPKTYVVDRNGKISCIIGAEGDDFYDVLRNEVDRAAAVR